MRRGGHPTNKLYWSALVAVTALFTVATGGVALADNFQNDVVAGGSDTITAGGSTTITYRLVATSSPNGDVNNCNVSVANPATVKITVSGATASPTSFQFTACGNSGAKSVTFNSSTVGDHSVAHEITGGVAGSLYNNQADWTLHVNAATPTNTAPTLTLPTSLTVEGNTLGGANVTYTGISASDAEEGNLTSAVSCTPASGSFFPLGTDTVNCSVTDSGGLSDSGFFTVTVVDTTAPVLSLPANITTTATGNSQAIVNYTASATDIVWGSVGVDCSPASGSAFGVGATTVNCSTTDGSGNTASGSFTVTVLYNFTGFFQPVDNLPIQNKAKAGSAIPVKFSLGGNQGLDVLFAGFPTSKAVTCGQTAAEDTIEVTVTAGQSSLSYDATSDQYNYVWKTDKGWANTCRTLTVKLADGSVQQANFHFIK
jgi:HYR domain